ncbi:MAG TPA: Imm50 family immunity protein [Terriglobales bacterium]|nr:Imm50 family immunity protein [Terriglobales bacterium]
MPLDPELESISGATELHDWFGYWPTFHDAVILKFQINQESKSFLVIHAWEMTKEVDAHGYYKLTKHVVVDFILQKIQKVEVMDLFDRGIIFSLAIKKINNTFNFDISSSYGLNGTIEAEDVEIRMTPGEPLPRD